MTVAEPCEGPAVAVRADRFGLELESRTAKHLNTAGDTVSNFGSDMDYPNVATPVAQAIAAGEFERAILVCGTGLGTVIEANETPGMPAAWASDVHSADRASVTNNAKILRLGARVVGEGRGLALVDQWLETEFQGGGSARRVGKSDALDGSAALATA